MELDSVAKGTNVLDCLECGKCTSNCPVSRFDRTFSPRSTISTFLEASAEDLMRDDRLWRCLTCGMCSVRCPVDVRYSEFTRRLRILATRDGREPTCSHGGALQSLMKIMTAPALQQNRMEWVRGDLKVAERGEVLYFVGCLPYFDAFFSNLGIDTLGIARSAVKLLNKMNITPVLLKNERCCGHDLYWTGSVEHVKQLATHNVQAIREAGAKMVVFTCAECYRTFKLDYPVLVGPLGFEVAHLSEYLAPQLDALGQLQVPAKRVVTYQDPCRLGRHLGVYDAPRVVLRALQGLELREMTKHGETAVCCGTSAWMSCDRHSKAIQTARLTSARSVGADLMVTSCPKCYIHFTCAMKSQDFPEEAKIEVRDLSTVVAEGV
ncbi:MAG: (Fe-S)-binding protein [candidate division KSB1 bacterium]|nr:(Fe-S)-binding protein [candidate division KSB1 bacterium]MDZ7385634.1 (Fe-S)-binding protein [candidate division KSB1 bacterium]MDZ7393157.1 (Fe-S)-binding protein [candidate division KSB1 bacterium]MDZ7412787.1 (Fe-S)-binding protein [candidate division KSB1 bacterium]